MWLLALVIVYGTGADSLGCPPSQIARELQYWHGVVVRTNATVSTPAWPGQPFSLTFGGFADGETVSVKVRGQNSAGYGCWSVLVATAHEVTGVPIRAKRGRRGSYFDLLGRRMFPFRSGRYFGRDSVVVR